MQWVLEGGRNRGRVLRRVLRRGSKKGLSRGNLEGRNTPSQEYDACPIFDTPGPSNPRNQLKAFLPPTNMHAYRDTAASMWRSWEWVLSLQLGYMAVARFCRTASMQKQAMIPSSEHSV